MTDLRSAEARTPARGHLNRASTWLDGELLRLRRERPVTARRLASLGRRPEAVLVPVTALISAGLGAVIPDGDAGWFRTAGAGMVGRHLFDVFTSSGLQIGPLYLLILGLASKALDLLGSAALTRTVLFAAQGAVVVWLAMWTTRRAGRLNGHESIAGRWAVGASLGIGGFIAEGVANGHPEEILLAILLANAALSAWSGQPRRAGALLALAMGFKQWATVGVGLLLLGRRRWSPFQGAVVTAGLVLAVYAPFFVFGTVRTFDFSWGIPATSLLGQLGHAWHATDWQLRVVQGGIAAIAGAVAAWRRPHLPLLPVVCAVAARLLLDPLRLSYYSGPLIAVLGIWAWSSPTRGVWRFRVPLTLLSPVVVLAPYLLPATLTWYSGTVLLIGVLAGAALVERRRDDQELTAGDEAP